MPIAKLLRLWLLWQRELFLLLLLLQLRLVLVLFLRIRRVCSSKHARRHGSLTRRHHASKLVVLIILLILLHMLMLLKLAPPHPIRRILIPTLLPNRRHGRHRRHMRRRSVLNPVLNSCSIHPHLITSPLRRHLVLLLHLAMMIIMMMMIIFMFMLAAMWQLLLLNHACRHANVQHFRELIRAFSIVGSNNIAGAVLVVHTRIHINSLPHDSSHHRVPNRSKSLPFSTLSFNHTLPTRTLKRLLKQRRLVLHREHIHLLLLRRLVVVIMSTIHILRLSLLPTLCNLAHGHRCF
mmetsp:Transcript_11920/g.25945  ORF Transcript_11920/g.25945 Transcript_11920/m.25945 type:complete len:293 (+) Transcript_11920:1288-2166(+)